MTTPTVDHEEAMLGCILIGADPRDLGVTPADLAHPRNAFILQAALDLAASGVRPDLQAVATAPGVDRMHVVDLHNRATVAGNAAHHAAATLAAAHRRAIEAACRRGIQAAEEGADPSALVDDMRGQLDAITTGATTDSQPIGSLYAETVDTILHGRARGLSTPWPDLDRHMYGLQPGRLYIIAARPGVGKSVAALNLAMHASLAHQQWTYFASLEMPSDEIAFRMIANLAGVSLGRLSTGQLTADDQLAIRQAGAKFGGMRIQVADRAAQTVAQVRDGARRLAQHNPLGMIVVDYLQLMGAGQSRRDATRAEIVGSFSSGLKALAKDLHVPVVALSQLNRNGAGDDGRPPRLTDLRESGSLEQDADVVLMLHPDPDMPGDVQMIMPKNRSGPAGITIPLRMFGQYSSLRTP